MFTECQGEVQTAPFLEGGAIGLQIPPSKKPKTWRTYQQKRSLSGHYSRDWSEYVNVIGMICEPFATNLILLATIRVIGMNM